MTLSVSITLNGYLVLIYTFFLILYLFDAKLK